MTDKKKLDEAATLNLSHTEGDMTATTTFTADDTVALAAMLKNAGIAGASNHFNGAASLVVDNSEGGMSTTIQAPNLRSIMQLLEPDFAAADQEVDALDAEADDDHIVDPVPVEEPCVDAACDTEIGFDEPVDATVDADGNLALAGSEIDEAFDKSSKIQWPSEVWDFAILCGKTIASLEGETNNYDAAEWEDYAEDVYQEYPSNKPDWTVGDLLKDMANAGYSIPVDKDHGSDLEYNDANTWYSAAKKYGYTVDFDGYGSRTAFDDNHQKVGEWTGQYGNISTANTGWLKTPKNEQVEEAEYDYREHDVHPHEYAGVADRKPVQPDTKVVPARSGDNPLSEEQFPDTEEGAISALSAWSNLGDRLNGASAEPDPMVKDVWLVHYQGGKAIVYLAQNDFETIEEATKPKSFSDYVREAEARNVEEDVEVEAEVTMESLLQEYGRGGADSYQRNSRQYGPPFFLNTDCGYASLNDLGTHEYFQHDGVVILAINRSGKWGLNYVAGSDNTKPGTLVTVVTPTSSGQKYREGKVVDSFTMAEYQNDRAGLEARLAQHGISPTKKLSVKTFD